MSRDTENPAGRTLVGPRMLTFTLEHAASLPPDELARVIATVADSVYRPRRPRSITPRLRADAVRLLDATIVALRAEGYVIARLHQNPSASQRGAEPDPEREAPYPEAGGS